jgi:hypothetical protein
MTIKEAIDKLPANKREQLMLAFEHHLGQYVELQDGQVLAVNFKTISGFKPMQEAGVWAIGTMPQVYQI